MRIAIGADHRGFQLKEFIKEQFSEITFNDVGAFDNERSDYPEFTLRVCVELLQGSADLAILICGTGVGMSIAANRFSGIYAGLAWNEEIAKLNKEHDNANILILPADFVTNENAIKIINSWLNAEFLGGRHKERLEMIDGPEIEKTSGCC
ncbi:MAG: ribose 5-phosphate isomerase B [Candidatus Babeliales bacterium]|nr:ribose 5-phosphate isomerase B [Candidatus Babeliales bacterium]